VVRGKDTLWYANKNLNDRPHWPARVTVKIYPASVFPYWYSNARTEQKGDTLWISHSNTHLEIIGSNEKFEVFRTSRSQWIWEPGLWDGSVADKALMIEDIERFLDERHIPLPSRILITRRDMKQNPVYGLHMVPVIHPFPKEFTGRINLLKQALYKSGEERFWDRRKDYSVFTGLWQYYLKKYVETRYPDMRLTGKPVRFFLVNKYYAFTAPYTEKYKLSYLYMARMNRDQALRLPADSLTIFNRQVTQPYKAALGWEFLEKYAGPAVADSIISAWFRRSAEAYAGKDSVENYLRRYAGSGADFLTGDFYATAKKMDYRLRYKGRKNDTLRFRLRNKTGFEAPYTLNGRGFMPPVRKDTLLYLTDQTLPLVVNETNPLPEINDKNNLAPVWKRPLRIRIWQDLEDTRSWQWFINPDIDYNYYDGLIVGMSINNKTFFDKTWTWEVIPDYGLKSKHWTGYASLKYKKHFVRPYLHGFSAGGYFSSYHYAPEKLYVTYSLHATLSHKNRREKFFRENDLSAEWLAVDKETDFPDETTSYGIFILSDTYKRRSLLRNMEWKNSLEWHRLFVKWQTDFRFRMFIDKFRQLEWRVYAGWMPVNRTQTDYFSFALSRPTDYLFKYTYYGRSETSGIFYQQYVYAEGAFKVFFEDQFADKWMFTHNVYVGIWKRFNLFADAGWMQSYGGPVRFHYDAGLRYYLVPDYFEVYFPLLYDGHWIPLNKDYPSYIRFMFVFDLPGLAKMFTRSWY